MVAVHRVLDANINRAAEGMRVLEDIARFVLENQDLCTSIKQCRHSLRTQTPRVTSRDTASDVGATFSTHQETERNSLHEVAIAAGNRCAEALRVVEEFLKLTSTPNDVETIRYEMYDLANQVGHLLGAVTKKQWNLCFVMTKDDCALPWQDTLAQTCLAGCDCIQVREKQMETGLFIQHVFEVKEIAKKYDAQVIVNDRVDVLLATGVAGVHPWPRGHVDRASKKTLWFPVHYWRNRPFNCSTEQCNPFWRGLCRRWCDVCFNNKARCFYSFTWVVKKRTGKFAILLSEELHPKTFPNSTALAVKVLQ